MSTTLKNIKIPYPTEGVIRSAQLNDTVAPENSVQLAINMNFDRIGAIQTRPGTGALYAATLGGSVTSFGGLNIQSTGARYLFAQVGTHIYSRLPSAAWSASLITLTSGNKVRYSQYLDRTWICSGSGSTGSAIQTSTGGTFGTTMVPASFPKADFIQAGFEGRVWLADRSTDTIYYTDIVQFTPPSYTLTYNANVNFIQNLSPQDGQSITGLCRVPRALLVFKEDQIFRIYGATSVDSYPAYNVGTYSQESIVQAKDGIYFHHSSGFYKFTYDSQPTEISRRVIDFIKAIPKSSYANILGVYDGYDAVKWSVGPVTVEGVTYANCQMRFSISTQVWTIYDLADYTPTALLRYDDGVTIEQVIGTSAGLVGNLDSGTTDFGTAIYFDLIDRWRSFTDMYSKSKSLSGIMVMAENGAGSELQYQTEKSQPNVWTDFETLTENYDSLMPNASSDDFNNIRLRLKGFSSGTSILFHGIEILSIQDKGLDQN